VNDNNVDGLVSSQEAWKTIFPTQSNGKRGMCWRTFQQLMFDARVPRIKLGGKNFMHAPTVLKHLQKKFTLEAVAA